MRRLQIAALVGWALLACGRDPLPTDVLVVGQVAEPRALDPHVVTSLNDSRILGNLYEGLVRFADGTLTLEPGLAEAWSIEDGGRRYRFHLRRAVRFHDGTPFDAHAVKFNFERMLRDDHPHHDTGPFPLAFFFEAVREVRVLDAHTVDLLLDAPFAPLLTNLAYPAGLLVSPTAVREHGRGLRRRPVGTGPFRFRVWESRRRVVLERNPDYWGEPARLRRLVFRPLPDPNLRATALVAGEVDLLAEVDPDQVGPFRSSAEFRVHEAEGPHLWFLILNLRHGPLSDRRVRLAVNYAIDREALVRHALQHTASVAAGPIPRVFSWANDPSLTPFPHAPARARALLRAAGYPDGVSLRLLVPRSGSGMLDPVVMATAIQADLAEVGIRAEIRSFEWNAYLARVNRGLGNDADLAPMAWMTNDPDTLLSLALRRDAWPERGGFNSGYYANRDVDVWIERARRSTDRAVRGELYRRIARTVRADVPWAVIASWRQSIVASRRVRGLRAQPSFLLLLHDVRKDPS